LGYIRGSERRQHILFPSTLDEYVEDANPVRVIAAFVGALEIEQLGFVRGAAAETGRPGYDPRQLMGLYIWGHLNKVRSSRKLERECGRNLEAMWLMENLRPDFKTIADFRKDNGEPIKQTVVQFRIWCQSEGLYGGELLAVDGSKFKAVNNRERNFTREKLAQVIERERERVEKYLKDIEAADQEEAEAPPEPQLSGEQLREKLNKLKERLTRHEQLEQALKESGESQISLTDGDARLMKTSKGSDVCYNLQTVVDSKYKLIVAYEVTNDINDLGQLANMAKQGQAALGVKEVTVLADGGYFDGNTIKECEAAGITTFLPLPKSGAATKHGVFPADQFRYQKERDLYICPQGEELTFRGLEQARGKEYRIYRTRVCGTCPLRSRCTTGKMHGRRIRRWVEQEVLERLQARIRGQPDLLKERKKLIEHPFGTIKWAMDQAYYLMKGIKKVTTETSLTVLSYNLKRVINIMGVEKMITSMQAAFA
jgi:transposase/ParB-like chromosome segregation protein Spo0J